MLSSLKIVSELRHFLHLGSIITDDFGIDPIAAIRVETFDVLAHHRLVLQVDALALDFL